MQAYQGLVRIQSCPRHSVISFPFPGTEVPGYWQPPATRADSPMLSDFDSNNGVVTWTLEGLLHPRSLAMAIIGLYAFQHRRDPLPNTNAHSAQCVLRLRAPQLIHRSRGETCAARS